LIFAGRIGKPEKAAGDAGEGLMVERHGLRTLTFENRATALGLAVEHLMMKPAFARLPFGHWSRILTGQIRRGQYFFIAEPKRIVGFCGWALASKEEAEAWISGSPAAAHIKGEAGDCIVLNAWSADSPEAHRVLLDELRIRGRGSKVLYAKREYKDGRTRPLRLKLDAAVDSHARRALGDAAP
jgi:hemolysin-activating ACP:hemolysin acyltransferase